ncbi:MAG: carboxypeptidase regulatory-like domain-containing protein, partial [Planctomycetes bacterium]|nr:carboxypeptidase regulatory-like domain-containing protein [Planctomycetota bacterium]
MRYAIPVVMLVLLGCGYWLWRSQPSVVDVPSQAVVGSSSDTDRNDRTDEPIASVDQSDSAEPRVSVPWGVVVDRLDLRPIDGATIVVEQRRPEREIERTTSDVSGGFALTGRLLLSESGWQLTVSAEGYLPETRTIDRLEPDHPGLRFELTPGLSVRGRVVTSDGRSVSGGRAIVSNGVEAQIATEGSPRVVYSGTKGAEVEIERDGTFRVPVDGRDTRVEAWVDGYVPGVSEVFRPPLARELTIVVRPGETITGTVTSPDGTPIVGARVSASLDPIGDLEPDRSVRRYSDGVETTTDAAGSFTLRGLTPTFHLSARHDDFSTYRERRTATPEPITIVLDPAAWLTGRVFDGDSPLPGCAVRAMVDRRRDTSVTDEAGRFRIGPIEENAASGTVAVPGFVAKEVSWTSGRGEHDLGDIVLDRGREIRVRVTDASDVGVKGVQLRFGPDQDRPFDVRWTSFVGLGVTDGEGIATVLVAPEEATVMLEVEARRHYLERIRLDSAALERATPGSDGFEPITVVLRPESRLIGRFVHGTDPAPGFSCRLIDHDAFVSSEGWRGEVSTGVNGPDGRFALSVSRSGPDFVLSVGQNESGKVERVVRDLAPG